MSVEFPKMQQIFLSAVEQHRPEDWEDYLGHACAGDDELRNQVRLLLKAHVAAGSVPGAAGLQQNQTIIFPSAAETGGATIGPYKLLQQIGEGGMGTVYMAEQTEPVQRKVALKLIKPGMDSRQVISRFEAERQALALMDHPHIAKVLDAGTTGSGLPYFVMELVKGVPITKFCDERHLTPRQRLELFIPVCQAVQHAHQKGIIHRDLKPRNVMVALYDGRPVPKVIDFGVAKATGQKLTERTMYTEFGAIVGTLEYMSPEQAESNQLDIDTRSDIYSLGVLLYELLTGTTPFEKKRLKDAALVEVLRIIREDEPPRPSTRLSTTDELPSISANRGLEPKKLSALVRGELDWIVMKALEKDRNRRYETANGFALDIQRYLADEPVQACPPSAGYRFRKFARRNRGPVLAAALVLVALLVGIAGTTIGLLEARAERDKAVAAKEKERLALSEADENLQTARNAVDQMYTRAADEMAEMPQLEQIRRTLLEDALKFYRGFQKKKSDDPAILYESALSHRRVGEIYALLGNLKKSLENHHQAVAILSTLSPHYANDVNYRDELARAHFHAACALLNLLLLDEGDASMQRAITLWERLTEEFPDRASYLEDLARANISLSQVWQRNYDARGERYRNRGEQLLARLKQRFPDHQISSAFKFDLKGVDLWRYVSLPHDSASLLQLEKECRDQLAAAEAENADHPDAPKYQLEVAGWVWRLANVLAAQNRTEEVLQLGLRKLEVVKRIATQHPDVPEFQRNMAWSHYDLAQALHEAGRPDEALDHYRTAITLTNDLATQFPDHARTLMHLAEMIRGCPAPELRDPKRALQLTQRVNELGHFNWEDVALEQMDAGMYRESLETCEKSSRAGRQTGVIGFVTAIAWWHQGKQTEARELARHVLQEFGVQPNKYWYQPEYRRRVRELTSLMGLEVDNLKPANPETMLRNGISIYRRLAEERQGDPGSFHELAARYDELLRLLRSGGRKDEANATLQQAIADYSKALEAEPKLAEAWRSRAALFIELRLLPEAAADFARTFRLQEPEDSFTLLLHAVLRRYADDAPGYRDVCERMVARLADSADPEVSLHIAAALSCAPEAVVEPSRTVAFAERAVANNKTVWRAAYLGVAYLRAEQFERAVVALQDSLAIDANWNPPVVYAALAMALHHQKLTEKAAVAFAKARSAREGRIESMLVKGVGFWPSAWWDVVYGELLYREACALIYGSPAPEDARWLAVRGRALRLVGRTDEARVVFERAFLLQPDNFGLRVSALPELGQSEDFARGLAELHAFLVEHPAQSEKGRFRLAQAHLQWGVRQWNADQKQSAEEALAQTAALMPEFDALLRQIDRSALLASCRKLADESLTEDEFRMWLGYSFWELSDQLSNRGHVPQAEETLRVAVAVFEKLAIDYPGIAHYRVEVGFSEWKLGWLMAGQNRFAQAEEPFRKALAAYQQLAENNPGNLDLQRRLAQSHREIAGTFARQGKHADADFEWNKAAAEYRKAIQLSPDFVETHVNLADVLRAKGQLDEAVVALHKAIELNPELTKVRSGMSRLAVDCAAQARPADALRLMDMLLANVDRPGGNLLTESVTIAMCIQHFRRLGDVSSCRAAAAALEKKNPADAGSLYNTACCRAQTAAAQVQAGGPDAARLAKEEADRAMALLTKAVAAGFSDASLMHQDADLDLLREREDFPKLLADVESKVPPVDLAQSYIRRSQWDMAAIAYEKVDLWPRPLREDVVFARASLYLIQGDSEGYNRFCQDMLQRVPQTEDHSEAFVLVRTCTMGRQSPVDPAQAVQWAKQAVARAQPPWYFHALGLAQYRAGQFDEALQSFSRANVEAWPYRDLNWFGMALAHDRLGHSDEARKCLDKGIQWLERFGPPGPGQPANIHPMDWLEAQVLRREAEDVLKIKQNP